eukprot:168691_1
MQKCFQHIAKYPKSPLRSLQYRTVTYVTYSPISLYRCNHRNNRFYSNNNEFKQDDPYEPNFIIIKHGYHPLTKREKAATFFASIYIFGIFGIVLMVFGYSLYSIFKSCSPSGKYSIRSKTFEFIKNDQDVINVVFGDNIIAKQFKYNIHHATFTDNDGLKRAETIYNIKGSKASGRVYTESLQNTDQTWSIQYCVVRVVSQNDEETETLLEFDLSKKKFHHCDIYVPYKHKPVISCYIAQQPVYLKREDVMRVIMSACDEWSTGTQHKIRFKFVNKAQDADIVFMWKSFGKDMFTSYRHTLARCDWGNGTIEFNTDKWWNVDGSTDGRNRFPLRPIALHELGHALGVNHSVNNCDVMYYTYNPQVRHLTKNDIGRFNLLWWNQQKIQISDIK